MACVTSPSLMAAGVELNEPVCSVRLDSNARTCAECEWLQGFRGLPFNDSVKSIKMHAISFVIRFPSFVFAEIPALCHEAAIDVWDIP